MTSIGNILKLPCKQSFVSISKISLGEETGLTGREKKAIEVQEVFTSFTYIFKVHPDQIIFSFYSLAFSFSQLAYRYIGTGMYFPSSYQLFQGAISHIFNILVVFLVQAVFFWVQAIGSCLNPGLLLCAYSSKRVLIVARNSSFFRESNCFEFSFLD